MANHSTGSELALVGGSYAPRQCWSTPQVRHRSHTPRSLRPLADILVRARPRRRVRGILHTLPGRLAPPRAPSRALGVAVGRSLAAQEGRQRDHPEQGREVGEAEADGEDAEVLEEGAEVIRLADVERIEPEEADPRAPDEQEDVVRPPRQLVAEHLRASPPRGV
eukprot:1180945-Prorocentrum_minimum.AAC.2